MRFEVAGQLTISETTAPVVLTVHDLGWVPDPDYGRRRIFALTTELDRRGWRIMKEGPRFAVMTHRTVDVIVHAEWVPDLSPAAA